MVQVITFDKNHNLQYIGDCKISLNNLSSMLIVEPKNEDYKMISASYNLKYSTEKNLLFAIAEFEFLDFCLIFKNEKICKKVYKNILQHQQNHQEESLDTTLLDTRILMPIFNKIAENSTANPELTQIITKWLNILDENSKQRYINLLKEKNLCDKISSLLQSIENEKSVSLKKSRKRKFNEMTGSKNTRSKTLNKHRSSTETNLFPKDNTVIIRYSQFKLLYIRERKFPRYLIIHTSNHDNSLFHEYVTQKGQNTIFTCRSCQTHTAFIDFDGNDNLCLKVTDSEHDCDPVSTIQENYSEMKIIKRTQFEIVENVSNRTKKMLLVFDSEGREKCHEFFWFSQASKFVCCNCQRMGAGRNSCVAKVRNEGRWNEYIELLENDHTCKKIKYDPSAYQHIYKHVLKPDFEIQSCIVHNREKKALILFDEKDRSLCHVYLYVERQKRFVCHYCRKMGKGVHAKLCQNTDGIEYIIFNPKTEHICKLRPIPQQDIILRPPKIEYLKETKTGTSKIFVFENENTRKLCYVFTQEKHKRKFICIGCDHLKKKKNKNEKNYVITGYLSIDENDTPSFHMKPTTSTHICKPKKYEPERYQDFKTTDFFYFRDKSREQNLKLAIYHPEDRSLCFTFGYSKYDKRFHCGKCCGKKLSLSVKAQRDCDNKEYFNHNWKKHLCEPIKVSTISKFIVNECSSVETKEAAHDVEEDGSKIVKIPNFELQPSQKGVPDKRLIVYHPTDKNLYWQYYYKSDGNQFRCYQCEARKRPVTAKLHINTDSNQRYVILGKNEHICEPLKCQPKIIIKPSNYAIFNKDDKTKPTKLFTFTSETRKLCYEFSWLKTEKGFRCVGCSRLKRANFAVLLKDQKGEEYVKINVEHVCEPQKFQAHEYETKTIPASLFQLCPNSNSKENGILLVFTSEEKKFVYSYIAKDKSYLCRKCVVKKLRVKARIRENESGEKFVELFGAEHICAPKKFNPAKYERKECKVEIIPM